MYCMFGPFTMAVKCWNVQCSGLIASLGDFFFFFIPFMKENERFIRRAIFNTRLKLKTGHARDTNKTTGNARLSRSAEWNYSVEKQTRLINNDGCVQESQLVGLNHYLSGAHLTFSFCFFKKKKNPELVGDQKFCCGSTCSAVRGCFKV